MQRTAEPAPSPASPTFAGLLAALARPASAAAGRTPAWSDDSDNLADDVATLSYERALHAHARYKSDQAAVCDRLLPESAGRGDDTDS